MQNPENREPDEDKKVQIVPVEQQIPGIKQEVGGHVENIDYKSNKFDDPFIIDFFEHVFKKYTNDPKVWPLLREKFKDQVVVDLGANDHSLGYFLSVVLGAKGYVGVEKFHYQRLNDNLSRVGETDIDYKCEQFNMFRGINPRLLSRGEESPKLSKDLIPASVAADDMLSFLRRLPDNSVSIFTFGITHEIISPSYSDAVSKEIERVLSKNGMYISDSSSIPKGELKRFADELKKKEKPPLLTAFLENEGFFVKK